MNLENQIDEETMKIIRRKIQTYFPFYWSHKWELIEVDGEVYTFETERDKTRYISYLGGRNETN